MYKIMLYTVYSKAFGLLALGLFRPSLLILV